MLRHIIIPGIIAAAAHAALLISPSDPVLPPPPGGGKEPLVITFPPLPPQPPLPVDDDIVTRRSISEDFKPVPLVAPVFSQKLDVLFAEPPSPSFPIDGIGDSMTITIPGNYGVGDGRRIAEAASTIDASFLDFRPRTLFQAAPEYPYSQKSLGSRGEVVVTFTVDEKGVVEDVSVVRSSHPDFEAPTVKAVAKWRFEPGRKDGKRVKFRMSVPVAFDITGEA